MRFQGLKTGDIVKCDSYRGQCCALKVDVFRIGIVTRVAVANFYVDWLFGKRFNYNRTITRAATREYFAESINSSPDDRCSYVRLHCKAL